MARTPVPHAYSGCLPLPLLVKHLCVSAVTSCLQRSSADSQTVIDKCRHKVCGNRQRNIGDDNARLQRSDANVRVARERFVPLTPVVDVSTKYVVEQVVSLFEQEDRRLPRANINAAERLVR